MTPDPRPPSQLSPAAGPERPSDASGAETLPEAPPGAATPPDPDSGRATRAAADAAANAWELELLEAEIVLVHSSGRPLCQAELSHAYSLAVIRHESAEFAPGSGPSGDADDEVSCT
jgi:hypothetical protein